MSRSINDEDIFSLRIDGRRPLYIHDESSDEELNSDYELHIMLENIDDTPGEEVVELTIIQNVQNNGS